MLTTRPPAALLLLLLQLLLHPHFCEKSKLGSWCKTFGNYLSLISYLFGYYPFRRALEAQKFSALINRTSVAATSCIGQTLRSWLTVCTSTKRTLARSVMLTYVEDLHSLTQVTAAPSVRARCWCCDNTLFSSSINCFCNCHTAAALSSTMRTERVEVWRPAQHIILSHFRDGLSRRYKHKHIIMKHKI